ncbi:MAG: hypothetical protein AB9858_04075 [Acidaminococcaceae bacterium]
MKKLLVLTFLFIFALQSVGLAAVSSSKGSSAPRSSGSITQKAPSTSSGYKSSAPASSYSEKAPTAATKPQLQQPQSTGNGFLRSAAMFGGGMLMGSMLGNMFGFGSNGMFSQIIGLLFNVMIVVLLFKGALYLWNRFRANRQ